MSSSLKVIHGGKQDASAKAPTQDWKTLLIEARKALSKGIEVKVHPSQVQPMPGQPRVHFNADSITRLADSIKTVGQVYPGIVRKVGEHQYEILDGERRWRAVTLAGVHYRALVVEIHNEAVPFLIAAIANFNREAHTPLEIADSIEKMHTQLQMPMHEVARALGITIGWAFQMQGIQKLVPEVREFLYATQPKDKRLPVSAAIHIAKMDPKLQLQLAERVLKKEVSLNRLQREAKQVAKREGVAVKARKPAPADMWRKLLRRTRYIRQLTHDLQDDLSLPEIKQIINASSGSSATAGIAEAIQDTRRFLDRCERLIIEARKEK